jgi:hypothetical protein
MFGTKFLLKSTNVWVWVEIFVKVYMFGTEFSSKCPSILLFFSFDVHGDRPKMSAILLVTVHFIVSNYFVFVFVPSFGLVMFNCLGFVLRIGPTCVLR